MHISKIILRKMSKTPTKPKTLSKKLAEKLAYPHRVVEVQDIEDSVKFFSPLQTRHQRKINGSIEFFSPLQTRLQRKKHSSVQPDKLGESNGLNATVSLSEANGSSRAIKEVGLVTIKKEIKQGKKLKSIEEELQSTSKNSQNVSGWEPTDWRVILENIRAMRSANDAPVDTMGCHKCSDNEADEKTQRFQKLVALMLSSQTKDEKTFEAMQRLKNIQMTPQLIARMERKELEEILKPVSFYKSKAKYMQLTSKILKNKYASDIPRTIEELEALPGVGPKMAHICMATAWNETTGIGVDVHVHRITNRLKWVPKPTKETEQTRAALESWLPREMWQEVNYLLVGFGQTICKAVRPQCANCLNRYMCPASQYKNGAEKKSERIEDDGGAAVVKKAKLKK